jgi:hypothetical protein
MARARGDIDTVLALKVGLLASTLRCRCSHIATASKRRFGPGPGRERRLLFGSDPTDEYAIVPEAGIGGADFIDDGLETDA